MPQRIIPVEPFDYIVFGGTGDLAYRKLLPALFERFRDGQIPSGSRIIAISRRPLGDDALRGSIRTALLEYLAADRVDAGVIDCFLSMIGHIGLDVRGEAGWPELKAALAGAEERIRAFYLAVGPDLFGPICLGIGRAGLATPNARVVIEKPIGSDLESARAVNEAVGSVFAENQVFRIDHYLGKETVQNLMALRFANALYEPLWNSAHVDHVQITVAESIGVGSRGGYYDHAGALRDMVQNHILQLLCLIAMEPPDSLDANAVRDEKLKVLKALKPIGEDEIQGCTVRGQYRAGASNGGAVQSYLEEIGSAESTTETFVALRAEICNWRWAGVPFYLRTGKRLAERVSEIVVAFKAIPHSIFPKGSGLIRSNRLVLRLQPDEGVKQWIMIKDPGLGGMRLRHVPLDMSFAAAFQARNPDAYERLLLDVVRGNQTLFMRRDEVEAAWSWIDPILDAWEHSGDPPRPYTAGTWGPSAAIALIERDGRTWHEESG
ncbi:glucose-6-phosphate dehydrogenase [Propylenella binzhouense]|uniref:Glucose-6-phosphate 1-dehydrogenase n=1 Tax=Propylenella binzhouense TaxID=2555902 RepID=A0A964T6W7_9HYPH|nr:glucose-6-phosphate dehydrogenase [Propylenella binzhouense]MYZ48944.1 glucose-6-phosphate dehydrogenase [Propylenella binzhouense]